MYGGRYDTRRNNIPAHWLGGSCLRQYVGSSSSDNHDRFEVAMLYTSDKGRRRLIFIYVCMVINLILFGVCVVCGR